MTDEHVVPKESTGSEFVPSIENGPPEIEEEPLPVVAIDDDSEYPHEPFKWSDEEVALNGVELQADESGDELHEPDEAAEKELSVAEDEPPFQEKPARRSSGSWAWNLSILLLLLVAMGQLVWIKRTELMQYPEGRIAVKAVCGVAGCKFPMRREPENIRILSRAVTSHPTERNALQIQLTIVNQATFSQPYPLLQIGLYDREEKPIALRRFEPEEYLAMNEETLELLQPGQACYIEMALEDPGMNVTGFQMDFF